MNNRKYQIDKFYELIDRVVEKFPRQSLDKLIASKLPEKGVYFFFENEEMRDNNTTTRVVRVGTHAESKIQKLHYMIDCIITRGRRT